MCYVLLFHPLPQGQGHVVDSIAENVDIAASSVHTGQQELRKVKQAHT